MKAVERMITGKAEGTQADYLTTNPDAETGKAYYQNCNTAAYEMNNGIRLIIKWGYILSLLPLLGVITSY